MAPRGRRSAGGEERSEENIFVKFQRITDRAKLVTNRKPEKPLLLYWAPNAF